MRRIDRISLDMDGVLAHLMPQLLASHGVDPERWTEIEGWDAAGDVLGRALGREPLSREETWRPVVEGGADWWAAIPPTPWCAALLACLSHWRLPIRIVSSPLSAARGDSEAGKRAWLERHVPSLADRAVFDDNKGAHSRGGDLLIDDGAHNVIAWLESGGPACLWPAPWNRGYEPGAELQRIDALRDRNLFELRVWAPVGHHA